MEHSIIIKDEGFSDLNPVQFGYENCNKSHSFGPAIRTHWLIHYVISGFGIFKIRDKEYNVKPGEMFVIPPYIETYYEADSVNPWSYIWIGFTTTREVTEKLLGYKKENLFEQEEKELKKTKKLGIISLVLSISGLMTNNIIFMILAIILGNKSLGTTGRKLGLVAKIIGTIGIIFSIIFDIVFLIILIKFIIPTVLSWYGIFW